ncbi:MAG TPA: zinc ABC transporter substrate-binding protein [Solirubrobacteraceae bacterium]|nr:zinc ABC transporter substrate-binding protein [Solirubrobacteraceae bacterium]
MLRPPLRRGLPAAVLLSVALVGCGAGRSSPPTSPLPAVSAVGAESQYADVIAQIGGRYVRATAILSNPSVDPHSFEVSPSIARTVARARLIVQNGLGYDAFMERLESAAPARGRRVIDVQRLLHLSSRTPNPHLWYDPRAVARVAAAIARDLARLAPAHAAYFRARDARFGRALHRVFAALAAFRRAHAGVPVASTEPVANYLLRAAGARNLTPWNLQADMMNGVDPAPQDLTTEDRLIQTRSIRAIIYNRQVTDTVTGSFLQAAAARHIPEVAVYETLPQGYDYQSWMLAELAALSRAVSAGRSTTSLIP